MIITKIHQAFFWHGFCVF